jgi:predicted kinase
MLVGIPGAGKSAWVNNNFPDLTGHYVASTDRLLEIYAIMRGATYNDVFKENIGYAEKAMMCHVSDAVMYNYNIIWDQTNISQKSRAVKLSAIPSHYEKVAVFFPTPDDQELNRRLSSRKDKTIPFHVINSMSEMLEPPDISEGFDRIIVI